MARGLIGKKLGMTQIFTEDGFRLACTVLELGPCSVVQKKLANGKDGYNAIKLGFEDVAEKKLNRPRLGVFKAKSLEPKRHLRELRLNADDIDDYKVGQELKSELFKVGDIVNVSGTSKGSGFAGVMKRHGFRGAKRTHGAHEAFRHGGAIGMCADPGKVIKGQKMPGQKGNKRVTVKQLRIVRSHPDLNLVLVQGSVPGPPKGLVFVPSAQP